MIRSKPAFFLSGGLLLLASLFFYINFRSQHLLFELLPSLNYFQSAWLQKALPDIFVNSLPSFLHILFMCFFSVAILGVNKQSARFIPLFWLCIGVMLEALQIGYGTFFQRGTFDWGDIVALFIASSLISILLHSTKKNNKANKNLILLPIVFLGIGTSLGSMIIEDCHEDFDSDRCVVPVTLSWEELRAEIVPEYGDTVSLTRPGKIYSKGYLYIVDQYRGIHIFDQTDPQNPIRIAYLPVIGALEISIQDSTLYTNSFIDLVAIDLEQVFAGTFNSNSYMRTQDVFKLPGNFDFIPSLKYIDGIKYDAFLSSRYTQETQEEQQGFIIGYLDQTGQEILFGEFE